MARAKLVFYVPTAHAETVKQAVFNAGAGAIGNYDQCCWQTEGIGQFRPNNDANPTIGKAGQRETVPELKIETLCELSNIPAIICALKQAHPYEEPAYDVIALLNF